MRSIDSLVIWGAPVEPLSAGAPWKRCRRSPWARKTLVYCPYYRSSGTTGLVVDQQFDQIGLSAYLGIMSRQVNLYEAKTRLSRLVEEAANGDTIIIAKDGKPTAKLGPI